MITTSGTAGPLSGTSTLLISPRTFGYERTIMEAVKALGGRVVYIDERPSNDFLTKGIIRIKSSALKVRTQDYYRRALNALEDDSEFDFILVISPEAIDESILNGIRSRYPRAKMVLYMWDSLSNKSGRDNRKLLACFDRILSFDKHDCESNPEMIFRPLFFRTTSGKENQGDSPKFDLTFIGTIHSDRYRICSRVRQLAGEMGMTTFFYLYLGDRRLYWIYRMINPSMRGSKSGDFSYIPLPEDQVNDMLADSRCVLDIQHPSQTGLTMRTIEVLGAGRKLLTTNGLVREYDFYDPDNIRVIDREKPDFDRAFILGPYKPVAKEIYERYTVFGWIKELFELS